MSTSSASPRDFGLESFADLLPQRQPIPGEEPSSLADFRNALSSTLAPATPYEAVIAESLVAIEWDILQHRRMRDASLREEIREEIIKGVTRYFQEKDEEEVNDHYLNWIEKGKDENEWQRPWDFDAATAQETGLNVANGAVSNDQEIRDGAFTFITALGQNPVALLGKVYRSSNIGIHEEKIVELERRRRDVKRDYDALQKVRPFEGEVLEK